MTSDECLAHSQQDDGKVQPLVKQEEVEREDCNLDLKVEVNIRAECGLAAGECFIRMDTMCPLV